MGRYCYRVGDEVVEVIMSAAEMQSRQKADGSIVLDDGRKGQRDYPAEYAPRRSSGDDAWPIHSEAAAVNPEDVPAAMADAKAHGVPTSFDRHGRPVLRTREHRRQYLKSVGMFDRDAGYGDPARQSPTPVPKHRSRVLEDRRR